MVNLFGEEFDTIEEVDALYRAQRRLSVVHGLLFVLATLAIPVLSLLTPAWYARPILGGLTLNFLVVLLVYPAVCWLIGLSYTLRANRLEEGLLGPGPAELELHPGLPRHDQAGGLDSLPGPRDGADR